MVLSHYVIDRQIVVFCDLQHCPCIRKTYIRTKNRCTHNTFKAVVFKESKIRQIGDALRTYIAANCCE